MPIDIVFATNDRYAEYLRVALFSLFKNNSTSTLNVYVLFDELSEESRERLLAVSQSYERASVSFIDVSDNANDYSNLNTHIDYITKETYYRYTLPDLFPDKQKILYLDVDVLVVGSIEGLWDTDLDSCYMAGVEDAFILRENYKQTIGFSDDEPYVNAGVLLFNLEQMRIDGMSDVLFETTRANSDTMYQDQDILNRVFKRRVKLVDVKYNYTSADQVKSPEVICDARIIHFTGPDKPWGECSYLFTKALYSYYAEESKRFDSSLNDGFEEELISIILSNYNYEEYVEQAIESVLAQTCRDYKLYIIDDGSTDDSLSLIRRYEQEDRIRIISQDNYGLAYLKNVGMLLAQGTYVIFLDADDYWDDDHLEKMYACITENNADIVYCDSQFFGGSSNIWVFPEYDLEVFKNQNIISSAAMIRASFAADHQRYFDVNLNNKICEDWDFWMGCALEGAHIVKCHSTLLNYRVKPLSMSSSSNTLNYLKSYNYIITKYRELYPDEFLPYHFYGLNARSFEYQDQLEQLEQLKLVAAEYQDIQASRSYKLSKALAKPFRFFTRITGRIRRAFS